MLEQPVLFTGCSRIQFFNARPFPNTVSQDTFGTLPSTLKYLCDLQDTIPLHWSPSAFHPSLTLIDQNLPLKKHIFKIAFSKNIFLKFLPQKIHFKNIFSKSFPQKKHLQNYSLKIYVFKIAPSKNINLIALIYSSLELLDSSEEEKSLKLSLICLITVFSMYLHSFKNTY